MLAAIPGELIGLVIFAIAALLKWLGDRASEKEAASTPPPIPRKADAGGGGHTAVRGDPEAERRRRFMEALGIPTEDHVGPSEDVSQTLRPEYEAPAPVAPRESRTKPIPPIVYQDAAERRRRRQKPQPTPPPLVLVPREDLPAALIAPAQVLVPRSDESGSNEVVGIQGISLGDISEESQDRARPSMGGLLREELQSPDSLRRAFLLREILGSPPGLQSPGTAHSFRRP